MPQLAACYASIQRTIRMLAEAGLERKLYFSFLKKSLALQFQL
jgi:hypothetical protein